MSIAAEPSETRSTPVSPRFIALVVALSFFMQLLDSTIVVTSLPQMARSFGIQPVAMSVGITVFMLTLAAFIPVSGWLGDRFGARNVFLVSNGIFTIASLFCGLSGTLTMFIIARAFQGLGSALMNPIGRVIVIRSAPKSELVSAVAMITWPVLIAPVLGPVIGSFITTYFSWHWNFLINVPIGIVSLVLSWLYIPDEKADSVGRLDIIGFILSALGMTLVLAGIELFVDGAAAAPYIVLSLVLGTLFSVLSVLHFRRAKSPLLDLTTFRVQSFAISTLSAGTALRLSINATPFLIPLLFQVGFGMKPIETGVYVLVYFAGNLAMKTVTTPVLRYFGFRSVLTVNGMIATGMIAACAVLSPSTPTLITYALLFMAGLSRSMQFTALTTIGFADVPHSQQSSASTLSSMLQQVSMLLGVAVAAAVLNISRMAHGHETLTLVDFRWAFAIVGGIGIVASLRFLTLPRDAGAEVSGHRRFARSS